MTQVLVGLAIEGEDRALGVGQDEARAKVIEENLGRQREERRLLTAWHALACAHRRRRPELDLESPEGAVGDGAALVESPLLRDRAEELRLPHDAVGVAQEQVAALVKGEGEERDDLALRLGTEVDEEVAATDEVQV
jgi:hypothetical protein